jgi:DNA-binding response OmpR family regulator
MPRLVLVVEDEQKIRDLLRRSFERAGFAVLTADTGAAALELARGAAPDLVVLDLGLPDIRGEDVAVELRAERDVPILVLTARSSDDDRIRGLELGVDDYVTKPFSPREVVLRVEAILRRGRGHTGSEPGVVSMGSGEVRIDEAKHEVTVRGDPVELTPTEWGVLTALASAPGRAFSRYELINRVRGYEFEGYERVVDSHVKNLRRKVERAPHEPQIVQTVPGVGYRLGITHDA